MTDGNATGREPTLFSAILTPHRSLGGAGFLVLMLAVSVVSFASGLFFFLIGAWPVMGFLGLDVLLIYWAFRISYRTADAFEEVIVTPSELTVRNVSHRGEVRKYALNPVWVRLETKAHAEFGIERLFLVSHGRRFPVAAFLGPHEKAGFAAALGAALGEARRGPTRTLSD
jgi:uncharacterized membrane protein